MEGFEEKDGGLRGRDGDAREKGVGGLQEKGVRGLQRRVRVVLKGKGVGAKERRSEGIKGAGVWRA